MYRVNILKMCDKIIGLWSIFNYMWLITHIWHVERMREATFSELGFGETAASEAKMMLEEHATGWGLKRDIDDDDVESLVLTWKGHSVVFCIVLVLINQSLKWIRMCLFIFIYLL